MRGLVLALLISAASAGCPSFTDCSDCLSPTNGFDCGWYFLVFSFFYVTTGVFFSFFLFFFYHIYYFYYLLLFFLTFNETYDRCSPDPAVYGNGTQGTQCMDHTSSVFDFFPSFFFYSSLFFFFCLGVRSRVYFKINFRGKSHPFYFTP